MSEREKTYVEDVNRSIYDIRNEEKDVYRIKKGLTPDIVAEISEKKKDPAWMANFRLQSLQIYNEMEVPDWGPSIEGLNMEDIVTYVKPSMDAAIAGDYKDLKFVNNLDAPIYIEGYTVGKDIYFNIYGQETRPSNRKVTYESEVVSEEDPGTQFVATGDAVGSISTTQGKHMGYVARLWKIVTVDGVEQSRDAINKSTYKSSPKIVNVGTASADPNATAAVNAALATGDEATIYATVAQYSGAGQTPAETPAETPADGSAEAAAILGTVDESQITENTTTEGQ